MCATQISAGTIRHQHLPLHTNTKQPSSSGMLRLEIPCPQTHVWRPGDCSEKEKPVPPAVPHCFSAGKQKKIWTQNVIHHSNAIYTQPWSLSSPENLSSSTLQTIHSLVVQEPRSGKQKLTHWKEMESPESWVLSLALPSTAPVTLDIVFFSEPRPQEDEDRRSLRVCPAFSVTTCLIASGIPGSQG